MTVLLGIFVLLIVSCGLYFLIKNDNLQRNSLVGGLFIRGKPTN